MNIGGKKLNYMCNLQGSKLAISIQTRDLDISLDSSMKTSAQYAVAIKKANKILD